MTRPVLGELLTAMVTPFADDGTVNHESARRMARHLVDTGCDGIVVCGTTGEGPTVNDREKLELLDTVVSEIGAGASVVANTGSYDTHHSVALTRSALAAGVDGFLVVTPYYNKPPVDGIVAHYEAIAEAAEGRPVIVYNIPQRVVLNLEPHLLARLSEIDNVIAVKQATADLDQARSIIDHGGLELYAGNDDLLAPFLRLGGVGGICVASHIAARRMREMVTAARAGDLDRTDAIDRELQPLYDVLSITTNPIPLKAALNLLGHDVGGLRLPLVEADAAQTATLQATLELAGI
ncbi:MAG TPA: 4-hydroxy-tetrahydrodipicolinate synthase, partial [Gaiellales bacterium]|nr:4-hydroxy-tetrahydrodipicolinate synthase [Gaiellales bacterium]